MEDFFFEFNDDKSGLVVTYRYGVKGVVEFPSSHEIDGVTYPVVKIGGLEFRDRAYGLRGFSDQTGVVIPDSVTEIDKDAFRYCESLKHVEIPNSVKRIGSGAFFDCISLTNIVIPDSLSEIEDSVFSGCKNLNEIVIPNSVKRIGNEAFSECYKLKRITLPNSLVSIGDECFRFCFGLEHIALPNSLKRIGEDAFKYSKWNAVTFPNEAFRQAFLYCYDPPEDAVYEVKDYRFESFVMNNFGHRPGKYHFEAIVFDDAADDCNAC